MSGGGDMARVALAVTVTAEWVGSSKDYGEVGSRHWWRRSPW